MPTPPRRRPVRPGPPPPVRREADAPAVRPPAGRRPRRWAARAATALSVLVLAASGVGHAVMTSLDTGIGRVDAFKDMKNRPKDGDGTNILLVGTDGRDDISAADKARYRLGGTPCRCTDTIILAHISQDRRRASLVSLPRDSYAELPEHTDATTGKQHGPHPVKLNAAYAEGGPNLTVRTVERMTGVKIDHYLEVDFTSFMRTVDAVGGVRICSVRPMKDAKTGLDLPAGTHLLDGGQALQYVRSRYVDGTSDLGRMQRQQRFLAALVDRASSDPALLNPMRFRRVVAAMAGSVRADEGFGAAEMVALAKAMRGFRTSSSEFTTVPVEPVGAAVQGVGSTVQWDAEGARRLFDAIREDRPLVTAEPAPSGSASAPGSGSEARRKLVDVPPEQVRVQVYNGTQLDGLGARVDAALRGTGFRTTRTPYNAEVRDVVRTVVAYDPRWDRSAKTLAAALPDAELREVPGQGPVMRVTAGTAFTEVRPVRGETQVVQAPKGGYAAVTGDEVTCA
ncbi:LCP family protein [Streptomyces sp. CC228A]|uniref:LCP family protein n=1 Tax=Streptomyces sp. CC228A TaxID=2898186 RepID=UPI001F4519DC|nr:LCP family protein [Streptomyces sp. CC228A]